MDKIQGKRFREARQELEFTSKIYKDSGGNDCTIWQLIERDPKLVAERLQEGEKAIEALKAKEVEISRSGSKEAE